VAADWEDEVALNYAPPGFVGPDPALAALARPPAPAPPNAFDPLAAELAALKAGLGRAGRRGAEGGDLPFGADKWGHDVIKKTIKGGQTSIVVGLVAALLAVALGTLFGALSGFYGGWSTTCSTGSTASSPRSRRS
jgi:ABC-type dipeptide/oligopeptide/nickel transport system permease subunit